MFRLRDQESRFASLTEMRNNRADMERDEIKQKRAIEKKKKKRDKPEPDGSWIRYIEAHKQQLKKRGQKAEEG